MMMEALFIFYAISTLLFLFVLSKVSLGIGNKKAKESGTFVVGIIMWPLFFFIAALLFASYKISNLLRRLV
jgi:hypothetical protein